MRYISQSHEYELSTGTRFIATKGVIGMGPDARLGAYEGFDGGVYNEEMTPAERVELADYMIAKWQEFRDLHAGKK